MASTNTSSDAPKAVVGDCASSSHSVPPDADAAKAVAGDGTGSIHSNADSLQHSSILSKAAAGDGASSSHSVPPEVDAERNLRMIRGKAVAGDEDAHNNDSVPPDADFDSFVSLIMDLVGKGADDSHSVPPNDDVDSYVRNLILGMAYSADGASSSYPPPAGDADTLKSGLGTRNYDSLPPSAKVESMRRVLRSLPSAHGRHNNSHSVAPAGGVESLMRSALSYTKDGGRSNHHVSPAAPPRGVNGDRQSPELKKDDVKFPPAMLWRLILGLNIGIDIDTGRYLPLYKAASEGDWESARTFISTDQTAPTAIISIYNWTALHVACNEGHSKFVEQLIEHMPPGALALQDISGCTALHNAVNGRSLGCVDALLRGNPRMTQIADNQGHVPLVVAAKIPHSPRQKEIVWRLCQATTDDGDHNPFASPRSFELLMLLIANEYLDIAFYLIRKYPYLASPCENGQKYYVLSMLIRHASSCFGSQTRLGFWESIISHLFADKSPEALIHDAYPGQPIENSVNVRKLMIEWLWRSIVFVVPPLNRIYQEKSKHKFALELVKEAFSQTLGLNNSEMLTLLYDYNILPEAAMTGIVEIFRTCLEFFPDAICLPNPAGMLLQYCIQSRQENVFNFLLESMSRTTWMGSYVISGDCTLHVAAKLAPFAKLKAISGSALQMQSEIQWFKAVEKILHPSYQLAPDDQKRTPQKLFTEEHKELLESGEKWMKDTANSCMLVATLIATVVFAATFTVPGGNNQDSGIPIFLSKTPFLIFAISDALALFSSTTSILMFLSILTSRFGEQDFLISLPRRMIIGLASLFFAIVTMMVAFAATLSIVLGHRFLWPWISIPLVTLLTCIPVALFIMLQLPLFVQMVKSTFWSSIPWR